MRAYKLIIKKNQLVKISKRGKGPKWESILVNSIAYVKGSPESGRVEIGFRGEKK